MRASPATQPCFAVSTANACCADAQGGQRRASTHAGWRPPLSNAMLKRV
jgi:hypothetical protein